MPTKTKRKKVYWLTSTQLGSILGNLAKGNESGIRGAKTLLDKVKEQKVKEVPYRNVLKIEEQKK